MSSGGLKLPLAVLGVAACAATTAFAASKRVGRSTRAGNRRFDIPPEILSSDCQCKDELVLAVRLALAGKDAAHPTSSRPRSSPGFGHIFFRCLQNDTNARVFAPQLARTWRSITTARERRTRTLMTSTYPQRRMTRISPRRSMYSMKPSSLERSARRGT